MRDLALFRSGKCFSSLGLLGFVLAVCLMLSGPAWGSATLYRGGNALGSVPTTNGPNTESTTAISIWSGLRRARSRRAVQKPT